MSTTLPLTHSPADLADLMRDAFELADRHAISTIEQHGTEAGHTRNGRPMWDVRPMLDPKLQCCHTLQMAAQAVRWARARRLVQPADRNPDVVVVVKLDA